MVEYTSNRYKILHKIGEGVHGIVLKAEDLVTKQIVAIKKVSLRNKHGELSLSTIREIKALQHCSSPYIMELLDVFPDLTGLSLVFEYIPYTLYSRMRPESEPLKRSTIRSYTKMILEGLKYMHSLGIMHRDIKPANLLINDKNVLKIGDFGLARVYDEQSEKIYSPQVASRWYRAPELLWGSSKYGPQIDLWAVGCVLAEMLRGIPLFNGNTDIEQLALVIKVLGSPCIKDWPEVESLPDYKKIHFSQSSGDQWENIFPTCTTYDELSLVDGLVRYNPKTRLTASEALNLSYFTAIGPSKAKWQPGDDRKGMSSNDSKETFISNND